MPWKGYFDIINRANEFILLDDVPYSKGDWRNRNLIKTPRGTEWLTIPVNKRGILQLPIKEVTVTDAAWRKKHWDKIVQHYHIAPYFDNYADRFSRIYLDNQEEFLSKINCRFIKEVNDILGITTKISLSSDHLPGHDRNSSLIDLCKACNADHYLSGPSAAGYLDEALFNKEGIQVEWMDYSGYPEYNQLFPPFEHRVTILDLLFNEGPHATNYMKSFKKS
ncbi:MAG: WbqC family protein [Chitinophagaceae bacterium]